MGRSRIRLGFAAIVVLLAIVLGLNTIVNSASLPAVDRSGDATAYVREMRYTEYLSQNQIWSAPQREVVIPATDYSATSMPVEILHGFGGTTGRSIKTAETGYVEWEFDVYEAGLYNLGITYYPISGRNAPIERELWINGERPFAEAAYFTLSRVWGDKSGIREDSLGNEIRSPQVEKPQWRTVILEDPLGYHTEPFKFYFHAGKNTIRLIALSEPMVIKNLRLLQHQTPPDYETAAEQYTTSQMPAVEDVFIKIQGEDSVYRSGPTLFPVFDQGDPMVEPYHAAQIRLNSIGGYRWKDVGQWITWKFSVPENGLYQIALKAKQDQQRGFYSNRRLRIDGIVPFRELEAIRFPYSRHYFMHVVGAEDGGEPMLFYLKKGEHELTLEVVLGDLSGLLRQAEEVLYDLNTVYRRIIMVTSSNPDPMRSYQLDKVIPGVIDQLTSLSQILRDMATDVEVYTRERGARTAFLIKLANLLESMAARPDIIPRVLGEYRDNVGALGTWIMQSREQPLQIDYLVVASPEQQMPPAAPLLSDSVAHEIRAFAASFTHDYDNVGDIDPELSALSGGEALKVWIGAGRDQAQVLKQMIEDSFTPETGIDVKLELVENMMQLLLPAIIARRGPDVALGAANMDLAFRGAVVDLTEFADFPEVAKRFTPAAFLPYRFRDAVYGLPETLGFPLLFYRMDVLTELGLDIPQTWEDLYEIIPELQQNNLDVGILVDGSYMRTFLMFLYQQGVALYKEDMIATNLESEAAIQTLGNLTELFTLYNLPLVYNVENRFRLGEMPIVIANYGLFNTLSVFAPELRGEWGFTLVPGTRTEDGTINRCVAVEAVIAPPGAGQVPPGPTGAVILGKSSQKEQAWEFLKWWTRTDTQVRFGLEMESLMGAAARYATANVEALMLLPWSAAERGILMEQLAWVEGVPPILGNYYVYRQFDWLFRAVVINNEPLRESVEDFNRLINEEVARKRNEFGFETDPSKLKEKYRQLYWDNYSHVYRLDY